MFELKENISLKKYNTFGFDVQCRYFIECFTVDDILEFLNIQQNQKLPFIILGGGSNILFQKDFNGYVLHLNIKGIEIINEDEDNVEIRVGAGEDWDQFVEYCVKRNWGGIENLSLIPGNVGTCPVQNIGAYGVEVKDVIKSVETIEIEAKKTAVFNNQECNFGYRDSIFKNEQKGKHIITHVNFLLNKKPEFKIEYGSIKEELKRFEQVNLKNIRQAVIDIRNSKLPKPEELGNSGSFFKNPLITEELANYLKEKNQEMPIYNQGNGFVKVPAGWLIEKAGWKGKRFGDAGVHEKQALVLVNHGNATGNDILNLAKKIQESIKILFGIELEMEVNIV